MKSAARQNLLNWINGMLHATKNSCNSLTFKRFIWYALDFLSMHFPQESTKWGKSAISKLCILLFFHSTALFAFQKSILVVYYVCYCRNVNLIKETLLEFICFQMAALQIIELQSRAELSNCLLRAALGSDTWACTILCHKLRKEQR